AAVTGCARDRQPFPCCLHPGERIGAPAHDWLRHGAGSEPAGDREAEWVAICLPFIGPHSESFRTRRVAGPMCGRDFLTASAERHRRWENAPPEQRAAFILGVSPGESIKHKAGGLADVSADAHTIGAWARSDLHHAVAGLRKPSRILVADLCHQ